MSEHLQSIDADAISEFAYREIPKAKRAQHNLFNLWFDASSLPLEERGLFLSMVVREGMDGAAIKGDERELARTFGVSLRVWKRLSSSLQARGLIKIHSDIVELKVRSPFEELSLVTALARQEISRDVRLAVYGRDGFRCLKCGAGTSLSCDHIIPITSGGDNSVENLRTLCRACNSRKGARFEEAA